MEQKTTKGQKYTNRLLRLSNKKWKSRLGVQLPYNWNLKRLSPEKTVDVGCGIGRNLINLPAGSIGIDHNKYSIKQAQLKGLKAYLPNDFKKSAYNKPSSFDSLLFAHVLEHQTFEEDLGLIDQYKPLLKPNGKLIIICPQEKGYGSDNTHVTFLDAKLLKKMAKQAGFRSIKVASFPFPKRFGKLFKYNEFVLVGVNHTI